MEDREEDERIGDTKGNDIPSDEFLFDAFLRLSILKRRGIPGVYSRGDGGVPSTWGVALSYI